MSESTAHDFQRSWWKEGVKRKVVSQFDAGLVGGRTHRNYLVSLGMPAERVFLGYDVVDNRHFSEGASRARRSPEKYRARLELPEKYFLASNRFVSKKNILRLVGAYDRYRRSSDEEPWNLVLLGDGPQRSRIEQRIASYGLSRVVHLPGFKQYEQLPLYYGLAGAFIHASTTEQWGLVVNEAMAAELPVLVSERCGCAPELVEDGANGFTFPPRDMDRMADLLKWISRDSCDRSALGRASREIIRDWTPETFGRNLKNAAETACQVERRERGWSDRILLNALIRR